MADEVANLDPAAGAADPAGDAPAPPAGAAPNDDAAPAEPADPLMALLQRLDQRAQRAETAAAAHQNQYAELRQLLNAQALELAALRGGVPLPQAPPGAAPPAAEAATPSPRPSVDATPVPRAGLVVGATPSSVTSAVRPLRGVNDSTRLVADEDDNVSVASHVSRHDPTSKNYQNFLRAAEKQPHFTGADSNDVNEWLTSVEELADIHGVDTDEVLQGLKSLLAKSARRFYREHLETVRAAGDRWDWPAARSWFLRKFNPDSRILRKVTEYHRCNQGQRSVNEYLDELLELRAYTSSGPGTDLEQRVR